MRIYSWSFPKNKKTTRLISMIWIRNWVINWILITVFIYRVILVVMFSVWTKVTNIYGNATLNLRWNHLFSEKLFSNLSLIYSDYYYGLDLDLWVRFWH
jgi:hypothetical protein